MDMNSRLRGIYSEKDINSVITKCNDAFMDYLGVKSKDKILGKTDFDFCWAEYAPTYRQHEIDALSGNHYSTIIPMKNYKGDLLLFLHTKTSIKDKKGHITGILAQAIEILNPNIYEFISTLNKVSEDKAPVYSIGKKNVDIPLTQREEECIFYLLQGKTAKSIGEILSLSRRTVEYYIENIKSKFGCSTKMELIDKAINEGYLKQIPKFLMSNSLVHINKI